ncbi:MAG: glycosyltransferase [Nocardiaceae bacterium]|nr:glycosyltransferase [Nocardiaceae bacterium]
MHETRPSTPTVSVVIAAFNARKFIDEQLDGLSKQTYKPVEVIVSDNGSTDGLAEYLGRHPLRDELNLVVVASADKAGAAHARNVGVSAASGELIAFCDADDVVKPHWLERMVAAAQTNDIVGGGGEISSLNPPKRTAATLSEQGRTPTFRIAPGCSAAIWTDVYEELGGMDTSFARLEDTEFSIRAQLKGYKFDFVEEALFAYRLRDTLRGCWGQGIHEGESVERLNAMYGDVFPKITTEMWAQTIGWLAIHNPLTPRRLGGTDGHEWVRRVAWFTGRALASSRMRHARSSSTA